MTNPKRYLEVTFRSGKPQAAYLSLERRPEDVAVRSQPKHDGYVVDFAHDGRVIGIEITAPSRFSISGINALLAELGLDPLTPQDVHPLAA